MIINSRIPLSGIRLSDIYAVICARLHEIFGL